MKLSQTIGLAAVSLVLGALAVVERESVGPATALAFAAVAFAALTLVPILREGRAVVQPNSLPTGKPPYGVREGLSSGASGREEIVRLLDRLDRATLRPDLPIATPVELRRLRDLPAREFRRYVARRLDEIEGGR